VAVTYSHFDFEEVKFGLFRLAANSFITEKVEEPDKRKNISLSYQVLSPETALIGQVSSLPHGQKNQINFKRRSYGKPIRPKSVQKCQPITVENS